MSKLVFAFLAALSTSIFFLSGCETECDCQHDGDSDLCVVDGDVVENQETDNSSDGDSDSEFLENADLGETTEAEASPTEHDVESTDSVDEIVDSEVIEVSDFNDQEIIEHAEFFEQEMELPNETDVDFGDSPDDPAEMEFSDIPEFSESQAILEIQVPKIVAVGKRSPLKAFYYPDHESKPLDASAVVAWQFSDPDIFEVANGVLEAKDAGSAWVKAIYDEKSLESPETTVEVRSRSQVEARGLWVDRWAFSSADDVQAIIDKAALTGFNQVYFQVRGVFDAYYESSLEPWAQRLSGTLGTAPGWDPLQTAIDAAHAKGIELHAWVNVFTFWTGTTLPAQSPIRHKYLTNPEWTVQDQNHAPMALNSSYIWASPGIPEVRSHNVAVIHEILSNYDVDGIHLDRIRYPDSAYSHDSVSENLYTEAKQTRPSLTFADWEREQVVAQVAEIYADLRETRPKAVLSAAVAGITVDEWGWSTVSKGYSDWLQDTRAMDEQEVLDVIIPMVYWPCTETYGSRTDFCAIVDSHANHITHRFLYIGSDLDKSGSARFEADKAGYESFDQIFYQIDKTRSADTEGWVLYDYDTLESAGYLEELAAGPFAAPAVVPFFWWK